VADIVFEHGPQGTFQGMLDLATVHVLGYVEDERTFSMVAFSKSRLRNHLSNYLPASVGVYNQCFYALEDFPTDKVYDERCSNMRQPDN
jgi:hypothetical protein